jgi:hypothetical protein
MLVRQDTRVVNLSPANWRGEILVERMVKLKQSAVGTEYISSLTGLAYSHQKQFYRYFIPTGYH